MPLHPLLIGTVLQIPKRSFRSNPALAGMTNYDTLSSGRESAVADVWLTQRVRDKFSNKKS
jgi:hypothetical protein